MDAEEFDHEEDLVTNQSYNFIFYTCYLHFVTTFHYWHDGSEILFLSLIYYVVMLTTESLLGVVLWFQESILRSLLPRELGLITFVERMALNITISYMHSSLI
jgi:hypothetical protein